MIRVLALAGVLAVLLPAGASSSPSPIPGFTATRYQGNGGTVWSGTIPGALAPQHPGPSYVYLPPNYSPAQHYPVVYLLHGLPGDPRIYVRASHLAQVADRLIADGAGPFVHAPRAYLAAHDPTQLVLQETARLRRFDTRFELSTGAAHGRVAPWMTTAFAAELHTLRLPVSLWIVPSVRQGPSYGLQMARGLSYAFARAARP